MSSAAPVQPASRATRRLRLGPALARIAILLAVIAVSVFIYSIRDQADRFAVYGYPGIFFISLLANATVLLPAPGVALVFAMASIFSPPLVALSAAAGATLGELPAYALGYGGQVIVERTTAYARILPWMHRYGALTIFALAAIPNPFFDLAGMAAGALRMPILEFLFWCMLGKSLKMMVFAYTGAYSIEWLSRLSG